MIAQRFRALGWVGVVASAATGLYLISVQVAAERGKLEAVEAQIAAAQRDMRQLQTEMGTRASMRQLERWNGDVLALTAPKATQFLRGEAQLASLNLDIAPGVPNAPPPAMASIAVPKAVEVSVPDVPDEVAPGNAVTKPIVPVRTTRAVGLASATPVKPRLQRVAMIDAGTVEDVTRIARLEGRAGQ